MGMGNGGRVGGGYILACLRWCRERGGWGLVFVSFWFFCYWWFCDCGGGGRLVVVVVVVGGW